MGGDFDTIDKETKEAFEKLERNEFDDFIFPAEVKRKAWERHCQKLIVKKAQRVAY